MSSNYLFQDSRIPERINEVDWVIRDKRSEFGEIGSRTNAKEYISTKEGGAVNYHFILDPHEISRYVFPIDQYKLSFYSRDELDYVYDSQIAYHHLFFFHRTKPIVLKEYTDEVEGAFTFFGALDSISVKQEARDIFRQFWDNIVNVEENKSERTDIAISVDLALKAVAYTRLLTIRNKICHEGAESESCGGINGLHHLLTYKPDTDLINDVCEKVLRQKKYDKDSLERDVIALDKTYFLNTQMTANEKKDMYLYFSSAARTEHIVRHFYPWILKKGYRNYNPWRNPVQIYLYLVNRVITNTKNVGDDLQIDPVKTLGNLTDLWNGLRNLLYARNTVTENTDPSQTLKEMLRDGLEVKRNQYMDVFHASEDLNLLDFRNEIYGSSPDKVREEVEKNLKFFFNDNPAAQAEIRELICETTHKSNQNDGSRIKELRTRFKTELDIFSVVPSISLQNDDVITNCYETFPFLIVIENSKFQVILDRVFEYWQQYYELFQNDKTESFEKNKILAIVDDFQSLSEREEAKGNDYYVLIALFQLMSLRGESESEFSDSLSSTSESESELPTNFSTEVDSNRIALDYLGQLENISTLKQNTNLLYIKANALRRSHEFENAESICHENIADYRFKQCYALALISKLLIRKWGILKLAKNIDAQDVEKALNYLIEVSKNIDSSIPGFKEQAKAATSADIVFLSSLLALRELGKNPTPESRSTFVEIALEHKSILNTLMPKSEWGFDFSRILLCRSIV